MNISAPMALPTLSAASSSQKVLGSVRGNLTSACRWGASCRYWNLGRVVSVEREQQWAEKEVVIMGRDDSDDDGKAGSEKGMKTWIGEEVGSSQGLPRAKHRTGDLRIHPSLRDWDVSHPFLSGVGGKIQQVHSLRSLCLGSSISQFWWCAYPPENRGLRVMQLGS